MDQIQLRKHSRLSKRYAPYLFYTEKGCPNWSTNWPQEVIRQLPEYPTITILRDYAQDPIPDLVITRITEEAVQIYVAQTDGVPKEMLNIWFMPMPTWGSQHGLVYKAMVERRQEHLVSSYTEALDLIPSVLIRWAL